MLKNIKRGVGPLLSESPWKWGHGKTLRRPSSQARPTVCTTKITSKYGNQERATWGQSIRR